MPTPPDLLQQAHQTAQDHPYVAEQPFAFIAALAVSAA